VSAPALLSQTVEFDEVYGTGAIRGPAPTIRQLIAEGRSRFTNARLSPRLVSHRLGI
jgi:hypothetical protein